VNRLVLRGARWQEDVAVRDGRVVSVGRVLVDGQAVVRGGRLLGADIADLHRDLARRATRVWPE
jgi:hypothetical protein